MKRIKTISLSSLDPNLGGLHPVDKGEDEALMAMTLQQRRKFSREIGMPMFGLVRVRKMVYDMYNEEGRRLFHEEMKKHPHDWAPLICTIHDLDGKAFITEKELDQMIADCPIKNPNIPWEQ